MLDGLPVPQRRALDVAVRRAEPDGAVPEPLAVAAGLLGALRVAAGAGPAGVPVGVARPAARAVSRRRSGQASRPGHLPGRVSLSGGRGIP